MIFRQEQRRNDVLSRFSNPFKVVSPELDLYYFIQTLAFSKIRIDMSQIFKFDCIFYYVSNLDKSIDFYTRVLGFHLESRDAVARFYVDNVLFELVPAHDAGLLSGRGNGRLTLEVKDIHAAKEMLLSRHVIVSDIQQVSNGFLAFFTDPDGNEIALWEYR